MSIRIDKARCTGCGQCVQICPGSLFARDENSKAELLLPQDCWGCTSCLKVCRAQALSLYLGDDMGGRGSLLSVQEQGDILIWTVDRPDGSKHQVEVDRTISNQY